MNYQEELLSETKRADKFSIEAEKYKAKCEATESDNFNLLQGYFTVTLKRPQIRIKWTITDYMCTNLL